MFSSTQLKPKFCFTISETKSVTELYVKQILTGSVEHHEDWSFLFLQQLSEILKNNLKPDDIFIISKIKL